MRVKVRIDIAGIQHELCSEACAFLEDDECLLFNEELGDTVLEEGHEWNDCAPTKQRCDRCHMMEAD